jgi:hypothetical protein
MMGRIGPRVLLEASMASITVIEPKMRSPRVCPAIVVMMRSYSITEKIVARIERAARIRLKTEGLYFSRRPLRIGNKRKTRTKENPT